MKKSIVIADMDWCYLCGRPRECIHHIYTGTANRKISDKHGFILPLCNEHHTGKDGIHFDRELDQRVRRTCQRRYEETHSREEFIKLIGRSYL